MKIHNPNNLPTIDYRIVKPLQGNLKELSTENYVKLNDVLDDRGFDIPLFLWKDNEDYYLMDGHQRQRVMIAEDKNDDGNYEVPYILVQADTMQDAKAKLLEITSQYGTITYEGLDEFIAEAELPEAEVYQAVHFDALPLLGSDNSKDEVTEDKAPDVSADPPISKLGEIYQLGRHRLMCGDATDFGDISELINGQEINLIFTDPPYGIDVVNGGKVGADFGVAKKGTYNEVIGDDTVETAKKFYDTCVDIGIQKFIIWGGNYFTEFLPFSDGWIIWDKRGDSGIRNTFADGEMAWCSFHTPVRLYTQLWNGMIREGEKEKRVHPTQKPVNTLASIVKDFTNASDIVMDLFGGSGSTLIACEQASRICYMMELDPKYCDVIRKRYHKFINDGKEDGWQDGTPVVNSGDIQVGEQ